MAPARGTMDFFAAQAAAKRHTFVLVVLFVTAIALTVAVADVGIALVLSRTAGPLGRGAMAVTGREEDAIGLVTTWMGELLIPVAGVVMAVVALGTAWHALRLAKDGGDAVARMLGGRPVDRLTQEPGERRAVNVLEEMALAAAIPVPRLYQLDSESGINAFAAGTTPERAVVAVTRGAVQKLTRDELQGVLAHELSHVLNHDARINLRLMALVGGLTVLALIGRVLLSVSDGGSSYRRRRSGGGVLLGAGLALLVAGAIGAFFGRLIRLAVSRQREFLADAAAVQFTRNPGGLASALSKVASEGSVLASPHAPEAAHLFFANGVSGFLSGLFSTHPPIEERIRRLGSEPAGATPSAREGEASHPSAGASPEALGLAAAAAVGRLAPEHLAAARDLLASFPPAAADAAREPFGARALALALLLDGEPGLRSRQLAVVSAEPALGAEVTRLAPAVDQVPRARRLSLLDLALPALDGLSADQAQALVRDLAALAEADGRLTLYEWSLQRLVRRRLAPSLGQAPAPIRARALEQVEVEALELLSALAWTGTVDPQAAERALEAGVAAMGVRGTWRILPRDRFTAARLDLALSRLDEAAPPLKATLLAGAAACVLSDGRVTLGESELLRAVAGSLGLPMPTLPPAEGAPTATAA